MRVCVVTRIFEPEPAAASQRLGSLCRSLADRGHDVAVVTTDPRRGVAAGDGDRSFTVRRAPVIRDRSGYVRGYIPYLSFDIPAFFRVLFQRRADVVVVEPPPTTGFAMRLACALRRTPYAYYVADVWSQAARSTGAPGAVLAVVRWMESFALRGAAVCLAVSDSVAAEVARLAPRARIEVVGHGVDDAVFSPDVIPAEPERDAVYVGTASEWHGASVFIEALALAESDGRTITVDFVGQGGEWDQLIALAQARGVRGARFRSPVAPRDAARVLRGARVALASVRPGVGYDYAVPTKSYSALSVGTPVLFSGPEPTRSAITANRLGWGCDADPGAVARALREATARPPTAAERHRIAEWARAHVSARAVADAAIDAIASVARSR